MTVTLGISVRIVYYRHRERGIRVSITIMKSNIKAACCIVMKLGASDGTGCQGWYW